MRFNKVVWSPVEEAFLKKNKKRVALNQLTIQLAKSRNAITKKIAELEGKVPLPAVGTQSRRSYIGKRKDCNNLFFRSRWEANVYRFLKQDTDVKSIEYEPRDFLFTEFGIVKGTVSYTPDFRVTYCDGSFVWIEVKGGLMAQPDKTKIRRFKKYFPEEAAHLVAITPGLTSRTALFFKGEGIEVRWTYPELHKKWKDVIPNWEG